MPVVSEWYNEGEAILIIRYIGTYTLNDSNTSIAKALLNSDKKALRFDVIVDFCDADNTSTGRSLQHWKKNIEMFDAMYKNWQLAVYVNPSDAYKTYFASGVESSAAIKKHCQLVDTFEEALQIIHNDREQSALL